MAQLEWFGDGRDGVMVGIAHQISPLRQRTEKRRNGLEHEVIGKGRREKGSQ